MTILLVHSDPDLLRELATMFANCDFEVYVANSVKSAITTLQRRLSFDVVLTDTQLADGGARSLLAFIRGNLRFRNIPVIICSKLVSPDSVKSLAQAGAAGFILLPVSQNRLVERVRHVLKQARRTVLVAETSHVLREILVRIVLRGGYDVATAGTANEVLMTVRNRKVDLVIVEPMEMGMNPWDLLVTIKEARHNTGVVFLVDSDAEMDHEKIVASGVDGVITKPLISTAVQNKVREVLQKC